MQTPFWTMAGFVAMLAYPPFVLFEDAILKFVIHDPTITAFTSETMKRRYRVVAYLGVWFASLAVHFLFGWLWGFAPTN